MAAAAAGPLLPSGLAVGAGGAVITIGAIMSIGNILAQIARMVVSFVRAVVSFVWRHRQAVYRALLTAMRHPFGTMAFIGDIAILIWG